VKPGTGRASRLALHACSPALRRRRWCVAPPHCTFDGNDALNAGALSRISSYRYRACLCGALRLRIAPLRALLLQRHLRASAAQEGNIALFRLSTLRAAFSRANRAPFPGDALAFLPLPARTVANRVNAYWIASPHCGGACAPRR